MWGRKFSQGIMFIGSCKAQVGLIPRGKRVGDKSKEQPNLSN